MGFDHGDLSSYAYVWGIFRGKLDESDGVLAGD